ncbi:unnamed protein product [Angiostrongylus costaricensis]|uniref:Coiled-coil domain-containing protein n=1 Tax=Angiostrongylus costaricensis TaxID=334426 RepID=A0A0R3PB93_ANGCS|nr:unnamed protein product [Angiostrongylus costaricensis]
MSPELLAQSDDSDDDGCEQRPARRRYFQKTTQRFSLDIRFWYWLFLCMLSLSVIYIAMNVYILTKRCTELSNGVSTVTTLVNRMDTLESSLEKMLLEFDLWRESIAKNSSNSSQTRNATEYVYDVMEHLTMQVKQLKKNVDHASGVAEDMTRRMTTVESRCLAVCRQPVDRGSDKQRRRQAVSALDGTDDVIIFRRN